MTIELTGAHTTARVLVDDESLVEESVLDQNQALIDIIRVLYSNV